MTKYHKYLPLLVGCLLIGLIWLLPGEPDYWRSQTFIGMIVVGILLALAVWVQVDEVLAVVLGTFFVLTAIHTANPELAYSHFGHQAALKINRIESQSFWFLLMTTIPIWILPGHWFEYIKNALASLCVVNSVSIILTALFTIRPIGILNNSSLDGTLIGLLLPFLIWRVGHINYRKALAVIAFPVAASICSMSTTAILVTSVVLCLQSGILRFMSGPITIGAFIFWDTDFFSSQMRFEIWEMAFKYWSEYDFATKLIGLGPGTFEVFGPHIQIVNDYKPANLFIWMHNDWLQILFEYGIVGFVSVLTLFAHGFRLTKGNNLIRALLVAYGLAALTQPVLRLFPTAFVGAFILRMIFGPSKKTN